MKYRYVLLVYLLILTIASIVILIGWNQDNNDAKSILFNISTELLGAVLIFFFLNQLFPINEEKLILNRISTTLTRLENKTSIFLDHSDSARRFDLKEKLENAKQIDMLGYSCVSLLGKHLYDIANAVVRGAHVRILIVKPYSPAAELMINHTFTHPLKQDIPLTQSRINLIKQEIDKSPKKKKGNFEVRYTTWIPSCGLTIANRNSSNGILRVQIYPICHATLHSSLIPHQIISKQDDKIWFDYFVQQYNRLWNEFSTDQLLCYLPHYLTKKLGKNLELFSFKIFLTFSSRIPIRKIQYLHRVISKPLVLDFG